LERNQNVIPVKLVLDLIAERKSRLCPCEGRKLEKYKTGFLFSQETLDSWSSQE